MKYGELTKERKHYILNEWKQYKGSPTQFCKDFGLSDKGFKRWLLRNGSDTINNVKYGRKYSINEHYFDVIDTEAKAYILGFLYADGYNSRDHSRVALRVHKQDREILSFMNKEISPLNPIRDVSGCVNTNLILFNSEHLSRQLELWGCGQAKTFKITFPWILDESLYRHFIRGYFDGDGSYTCNKVAFIGTESLMDSIQNIFYQELGIKKSALYYYDKTKNIASFYSSGWEKTCKIYNYLYQGATIFLNRKKIKFEERLDSPNHYSRFVPKDVFYEKILN